MDAVRLANNALNDAVIKAVKSNEYEVIDYFTVKLSNGTLISRENVCGHSFACAWFVSNVALYGETKKILDDIVRERTDMEEEKKQLAAVTAALVKVTNGAKPVKDDKKKRFYWLI